MIRIITLWSLKENLATGTWDDCLDWVDCHLYSRLTSCLQQRSSIIISDFQFSVTNQNDGLALQQDGQSLGMTEFLLFKILANEFFYFTITSINAQNTNEMNGSHQLKL